ncbi:MAG: V4R domain-containing protein [Candidatus Jordarchaeales archaeon]
MSGEATRLVREFMKRLKVTVDGSLVADSKRFVFTPGLLVSVAIFAVPVERFGGSVKPLFRRAFIKYGTRRAMKDEGLGARGALEKYLADNTSTGFGRGELVEFNEQRVVFRVYGSLYGEEAGNYFKMKGMETEPLCTQGFVAEGILNYFAEKEGKPLFSSQEVKCRAVGDEYCEFVLERKT